MKPMDLKRIILEMVEGKEFYGYEIHKTLASEGIKTEISYVYRVLGEMLREGLLESHWEKSQFGPKKRVYCLGEKGKNELHKILLDAIETIHTFYSKYLLGLPPKTSVFNSICKLLTCKLKGQGNIAYVTSNYSTVHERMINSLHNKVPRGRIYLVKPKSLVTEFRLDNLILLDGEYNSIPLRDSYIDLAVITGVPKKGLLETALKEWRRVIKESGKLAILTSTVSVYKCKDPLTIGNFIEKCEHETLRRDEYVDSEFLKARLKNFFERIEEKQIVHMTIFLASKQSLPSNS